MKKLTSAAFAKKHRNLMEEHAEKVRSANVARLVKRIKDHNDHSAASGKGPEPVEIIRDSVKPR